MGWITLTWISTYSPRRGNDEMQSDWGGVGGGGGGCEIISFRCTREVQVNVEVKGGVWYVNNSQPRYRGATKVACGFKITGISGKERGGRCRHHIK